jgi:hypothetical protein
MSQINEIRDLLRSERTVTGRVISVANGVARVSTPTGIVEIAADGDLESGDMVAVESGRAVKKQKGTVSQTFSV